MQTVLIRVSIHNSSMKLIFIGKANNKNAAYHIRQFNKQVCYKGVMVSMPGLSLVVTQWRTREQQTSHFRFPPSLRAKVFGGWPNTLAVSRLFYFILKVLPIVINSCVSKHLRALVVQRDFIWDQHYYLGIIKH